MVKPWAIANLLATEPASIQLRYLQTLTEIGVEKNTTVVFPIPIDIFSKIVPGLAEGTSKAGPTGGGAAG